MSEETNTPNNNTKINTVDQTEALDRGRNDSQIPDDMSSLESLVTTIDREMAHVHGVMGMGEFAEPLETVDLRDRYIVFSTNNVKYAVHIKNVIEIGNVPAITTIPNSPSWLRGVTNIRGDIISVIDLTRFMGEDRDAPSSLDAGKIIVVSLGEDELTTALLVDRVNNMLSIEDEGLIEPSAPMDNRLAPYLDGVYKDGSELLIILNLEKFLQSSDIRQFD